MNKLEVKSLVFLFSFWLIVEAFNLVFHHFKLDTDTPIVFPFSVFRLTFHLSGLPFVALMFLVVLMALKRLKSLNSFALFGIFVLVLILGNLGQGSIYNAFSFPFVSGNITDEIFPIPFNGQGIQYYDDAIKIQNWQDWLFNFNQNQEQLLMHSRTHPPFAVLLHYWLLQLVHQNIVLLCATFTAIFVMIFWIINRILTLFNLNIENKNAILLFFAVLPSFNIYGISCIDAIICVFISLSFLGLVEIVQRKNWLRGTLLIVIGSIFTNSVTFGGTFIFAFLGLYAIYQLVRFRDFRYFLLPLISFLILIVYFFMWFKLFGYNHLLALHKASEIENPLGFALLSTPLRYFMTRLEDVFEFLVFASVLFATYLFICPKMIDFKWHLDLGNKGKSLFYAAIVAVVLMLLSGAFRTGETGRALMFLYPFFLIPLLNTKLDAIKKLIVFAAIQTAFMQIFGWWVW